MKQHKCPNCGTEDGLYRRADVRWQPGREAWETVADIGSEVDCTQCDWSGDVSETVPA